MGTKCSNEFTNKNSSMTLCDKGRRLDILSVSDIEEDKTYLPVWTNVDDNHIYRLFFDTPILRDNIPKDANDYYAFSSMRWNSPHQLAPDFFNQPFSQVFLKLRGKDVRAFYDEFIAFTKDMIKGIYKSYVSGSGDTIELLKPSRVSPIAKPAIIIANTMVSDAIDLDNDINDEPRGLNISLICSVLEDMGLVSFIPVEQLYDPRFPSYAEINSNNGENMKII